MLEEPLTEQEADHLLQLKHEVMNASNLGKSALRRKLRYRLFRIREYENDPDRRAEFDKGLKKFIEAQFSPPMKWENFTFEWDIGVEDPLTIVTPFNWIDAGGQFEEMNVMCDDGVVRRQRICQPTAFTQQEI